MAEQPTSDDARFINVCEYDIAPGRLADYLHAYQRNAQASEQLEPGVLSTSIGVAADPATPNKVILTWVFANQAAFDEHVTTSHAKHYKAAVSDLITYRRIIATHSPF